MAGKILLRDIDGLRDTRRALGLFNASLLTNTLNLLAIDGTPLGLVLLDVGPLLRGSARTKRTSSVTLDGIDDLGPGNLAPLVGIGRDMTTKRVDLYVEWPSARRTG